jgi:hypothetical protein
MIDGGKNVFRESYNRRRGRFYKLKIDIKLRFTTGFVGKGNNHHLTPWVGQLY